MVVTTDNHFHPSLIFEGKFGSPWKPLLEQALALFANMIQRWKRLVVTTDNHFHPSLIFAGKVGSPWTPLLKQALSLLENVKLN